MEFRKDKSSILYFILAIVCFLAIISSLSVSLFEPLFRKVNYGQRLPILNATYIFVLWIIEIIAILVISFKTFKIDILGLKRKDKEELSVIRILILFLMTLVPIFLISGILGWKLKIVDDLGERITGDFLTYQLCEYGKAIPKMFLVTMMIKLSQEAFDKIFITKYFIPWGGIFTMFTFGLYELLTIHQRFSVLYFFFPLIYGTIYFISKKNFLTTFFLSYLIYLL